MIFLGIPNTASLGGVEADIRARAEVAKESLSGSFHASACTVGV